MLPDLQKFVDFLTGDAGRQEAPSLHRHRLRCMFRADALEFASAAPACANLVKNGVLTAWGLQGETPISGQTGSLVEVWLRTLVHDVIERKI